MTTVNERFYFTFGSGQKLAHCFVVIPARNLEEARDKMWAVYGKHWAFSYGEKDFLPQIERFGLKEVPFGTPNKFSVEVEQGQESNALPPLNDGRPDDGLRRRRGGAT